jgi:membrane protein DedA with SNARE-associated domain
MPFWRFTWLTLLGCIPWVFALGYLGKVVGSNWDDWKDRLHYLDYVVLAAIVGLIVYAVWKRRRGAQPGSGIRAGSEGDAEEQAVS